jgi:hypothetical protein
MNARGDWQTTDIDPPRPRLIDEVPRLQLVGSWARHMRVPWWSPWWAIVAIAARPLAIGTFIVAAVYIAALAFSICTASAPSAMSSPALDDIAVRAGAHGRGTTQVGDRADYLEVPRATPPPSDPPRTLDPTALGGSAAADERADAGTAGDGDDSHDVVASRITGGAPVREIIARAAREFGVDPVMLDAVAFCESSYRPAAVGDDGAAIGLFQFHEWRWWHNAPALGYSQDLRADPVAASRVAAYAFSTGQRAAWTCAR